jgi:hypothetical protein
MLENLSKQARHCLQRAEECGQRAKHEPDPILAKDYLEMERRWLNLARSYAFLETVAKNYRNLDEQTGPPMHGAMLNEHPVMKAER